MTIAELTQRSSSTSRELGRNAWDGSNASRPAQRRCQQWRIAARLCSKLRSGGALRCVVTTMLCWLWSPQQIARTFRLMHPNDHAMHESIFTAIYAYPREVAQAAHCITAPGQEHAPPALCGG